MTLICPITGSSHHRLLVEQNGYAWIEFADSGFIRLRDMPSLAEAAALQDETYTQGYVGDYRRKWASKRRRSLGRARALGRRIAKGGRMLDVGSNVGLFVDAARRLGFDAEGIEINPALADYARTRFPGLTFHAGALETFAAGGRRFDGIYCSEVIEHVPDPLDFARRLRALLAPGGTLYLTTPAREEFVSAGVVTRDLGAPDHKLYFSRRNIADFLAVAGFRHVRKRFSLGRGIQVFADA